MFSDTYNEKTASRSAKRIIKKVEQALAGEPIAWRKVVRRLPVGEEWELVDWARQRLAALPLPFDDRVVDTNDPWLRERRILERFIAEIYDYEGNPEPLIQHLRQELLCFGGDAERLLLLLADIGRDMEAWVLSKYALGLDVGDRNKVLAVQGRLAAVPEGWTESVEQLAEDPTPEAWRALMSFVPDDNIFFTIQHTIYLLRDLGADPNAIFKAAVQDGATSALLELVDTGLVDPDVVVDHAERAAQPAFWIALAARSAYERGDDDRCIALAARVTQMTDRDPLAALQLHELWERADDELRELLDGVGVRKTVAAVLDRDAR